jgi:biopolymer transport protein TolR
MESTPRKRRLMAEINVVPLIDVMLVLLVIFMATAPLLTQGVKVELPQASSEPLPVRSQKDQPPMILTIDARGARYLNIHRDVEQALEDAELEELVRAALQVDPDRDVLLRGDESVPYGQVMAAMVLLQHSGAVRVGFLTDPLPPDARPRP